MKKLKFFDKLVVRTPLLGISKLSETLNRKTDIFIKSDSTLIDSILSNI